MNRPDFIIDSHVHFWNPQRLSYPWLVGVPALNRVFVPDDYAAATKAVNVEKMIFVECGCEAIQNHDEVELISKLAVQETRLKGIIAHAPLERGAAVQDELFSLAQNSLVKGIRRTLQSESDANFCLRPDFIAGLNSLAEYNFTFDICVSFNQLPAVIEMVRRCPDVCFILDHCGKPRIRKPLFELWAGQMILLAALPNVSCKISGLLTEADLTNWKASDVLPFVRHAIHCFGFNRVLFGGDWPVLTLAGNYLSWLETVLAAVPFATDADITRLFQTNAEEIYHV